MEVTQYQHKAWCRHFNDSHEAARRVADTYNLHLLADYENARGKWFAVRLDDGRSDNVLYDNKYDAVTHQKNNEKYYAFICIKPTSMNPCEAEVMLKGARMLYAKGMRMADPDHRHGGPSLISRLMIEDELAAIRGVVRNVRMPWEGSK